MAAKIKASDWDVLFAPNAPRRGGPLRALLHVLIVIILIVVVTFGTRYLLQQREEQVATAIANATAVAATMIPRQTATAQAESAAQATVVAEQTATAGATPTAVVSLGIGAVNRGGNLRSEPRVADNTVVGLIWPGDQIVFLDQQTVDGQEWYRIRVTAVAPNRGGEGVPVGQEGWAAASLLSPVAQPQP